MALSSAEKAEMVQLEKDVGGDGLSPQEQAEMKALQGEVGHLASPTQNSTGEATIPPPGKKSLGGQIWEDIKAIPGREYEAAKTLLSGAGKVLDYPGGLVRTGLASAGGMLSGQPNAVKEADVANAFKGEAPLSSEYMGRLGAPEGPSVGVPFTDRRVSARDVGGFVADIATNPLNYGGKAAAGLLDAGEATAAAGKNLYKSGFKKIDEKLLEKGKGPVSDILLENGAPTGTTKQLSENMSGIAGDVATKRGEAYDKINQLAGPIDLSKTVFQKAEARLAELRAHPSRQMKALADSLEQMLNDYKSAGHADVSTISDWKTALADTLPENAYAGAKTKAPAKKFIKDLASDFRNMIVDHGNAAEKGLGDHVDKLNDTWSSLISAEKPMAAQIGRGESINAITPIDAALGVLHPGAEIAKKGADIAKTTWARTNLGKGLINVGESGAVDPTLRQTIINAVSNKKKNGLLDQEEKRPELRLSQ